MDDIHILIILSSCFLITGCCYSYYTTRLPNNIVVIQEVENPIIEQN